MDSTPQAVVNHGVMASPVADRVRRRIARRILPYLFFLYIIAYLDRVNVSFAALDMTTALGFTPQVYGFGAGIFFFGYFLLEIPGSILVERWSARKWIARIMVSWGIVAMFEGFMHTSTQFYWLRFLLGVSEAGFFPGIVVYLSHWFRYEDRAKGLALFMAAQPIANIIGAPLSGWLLGIHWFGMEGWRWLFFLEGMPAVVLGIVTIFYLTDWPHQAAWLQEDERQWITAELAREKQATQMSGDYGAGARWRQRNVLLNVSLLTLAYFCCNTAIYGFTFWLPTIIKKLSGFSNLFVTLIAALPYCAGLVAILVFGWSSDRTGERRGHASVGMILAAIGLLLSVVFQNAPALAIAMFCLAAIGMYGYVPAFWSLPTSFLTGTAAAASIGLINSVGNLGGFVGPYIVGSLSKATQVSFAGVIYLSLSAVIAACLLISLRTGHQRARPAAEGMG